MCDCHICKIARELVARDDYIPEALCFSPHLAAMKRGEFSRDEASKLGNIEANEFDTALCHQIVYFLMATRLSNEDPKIAEMAEHMGAFHKICAATFDYRDTELCIYEIHANDVRRAVKLERGQCLYPGARLSFKYLADNIALINSLDSYVCLQDELQALHGAHIVACAADSDTPRVAVEVATLALEQIFRQKEQELATIADENILQMAIHINLLDWLSRDDFNSLTLGQAIYVTIVSNALRNVYQLVACLENLNAPAATLLKAQTSEDAARRMHRRIVHQRVTLDRMLACALDLGTSGW